MKEVHVEACDTKEQTTNEATAQQQKHNTLHISNSSLACCRPTHYFLKDEDKGCHDIRRLHGMSD